MDLSQFLAIPGRPCIRFQLGPEPLDVIEVDQHTFEELKDALADFCRSIPDVEGQGWESLRVYTGGNGALAKLLVALGDLVGAWVMHPPRESAIPWNQSHPRVLLTHTAPTTKIPKPSAGDLEKAAEMHCDCCERPMGSQTSMTHDLVAYPGDSTLCMDCGFAGCEETCGVFRKRSARKEKRAPELPQGPPQKLVDFLERYKKE